MLRGLLLVLFWAFFHQLKGEIDTNYLTGQPDYEDAQYDSLRDQYDEQKLVDEKLRISPPKLQRFMDALIREAGIHYLYPPGSIERSRMPKDARHGHLPYERDGEPEFTNLIKKRTSEDENCPKECFQYSPVCGSDRKVYESECHFLKANCGLTNVTVVDWEFCRGRHFLCPTKCLDISDPVCGDDGRMYHNICVMRKRNCGKLLETRPIKHCYARGREPKVYETCPEDCQEVYKPVCGSDGVLYYNACFMKMRTCGSQVEVLDLDACTESQKCPERCIPIYDPVCGSDGKLYVNLCKMFLENCGENIKRVPASFCGGIRRG